MPQPSQAPDASKFQIPQNGEGIHFVEPTTEELTLLTTEAQTFVNNALDLAISAGARQRPFHNPDMPIYDGLARVYDERFQFEKETNEKLARIHALSQNVHDWREYSITHRTLFRNPEKARERFWRVEGQLLGSELWKNHDRNQLWDFHHEFRDSQHEWILTIRDRADLDHSLFIYRYLIEHPAAGVTQIRRVVSQNDQLGPSVILNSAEDKNHIEDLNTFANSVEQAHVLLMQKVYTKR